MIFQHFLNLIECECEYIKYCQVDSFCMIHIHSLWCFVLIYSVIKWCFVNNWIMIIKMCVCVLHIRYGGSLSYCQDTGIEPPPSTMVSCPTLASANPPIAINKIWWVMKKLVLFNTVCCVDFALFIMVV